MKSLYVLFLALAVSAVSCRTKEGEPGPAGESSLNKQGSVSGTITYTKDNGGNATVPFDYTYFESLDDNRFYYDESGTNAYYEVDFQRRDLKDDNNYFRFNIEGYSTDGVEDETDDVYINFSLLKVINNELYEFYGSGYNVEVTNVNLDPTTGRLTFNFSGTINYNGTDATITGKADVILNRSRPNPS